jgi:hypothetical protein
MPAHPTRSAVRRRLRADGLGRVYQARIRSVRVGRNRSDWARRRDPLRRSAIATRFVCRPRRRTTHVRDRRARLHRGTQLERSRPRPEVAVVRERGWRHPRRHSAWPGRTRGTPRLSRASRRFERQPPSTSRCRSHRGPVRRARPRARLPVSRLGPLQGGVARTAFTSSGVTVSLFPKELRTGERVRDVLVGERRERCMTPL